MRTLSCYKSGRAGKLEFGGVGLGGALYWQDVIGRELQKVIASELGAALVLNPYCGGRDNRDPVRYDVSSDGFDIAYLELFDTPSRRPADFVWSMISDYIGMEKEMEGFLASVKPNLLISLQYPLNPPEAIPHLPQLGKLPNLSEQCVAHGCKVVLLPWFNTQNRTEYNPNKMIPGMCTGRMGSTYPFRNAAWMFLQKLNRPDVILSGNPTGSTFSLSDEDYRRCLGLTKYYFTGGIYDLQIPPKVYEVMNYGACLVCHDMPMMEASGLIPGETYLPIESVEEIPAILERDDWKEIAPKGQAMVHERHSLQARARDFVRVYREITGNG
ncbi:MAG TPA: glycosyltransferase [Sedimentisphaerales bacterium]|nr:glycosyltransferase [Sedimentisphaerales bacterium]